MQEAYSARAERGLLRYGPTLYHVPMSRTHRLGLAQKGPHGSSVLLEGTWYYAAQTLLCLPAKRPTRML